MLLNKLMSSVLSFFFRSLPLPRVLVSLLLGFVSSNALLAEDPFEKRTFSGADGHSLSYRLLSPPNLAAGQKYPLVVFLHGAGERGNNNESQLQHCVRDFAKPENLEKYPCFVLAPQCESRFRWCEVDWGDPKPHLTPKEPSVPTGLLLSLLAEFTKQPAVDTDRLYITGLSMGGFGTWDMITRNPGMFAAAAPICGGADVSAAPSLANLPIWVFHGGADGVVKTVRSHLMIEALKAAGSKTVKYSEYPGVGHGSWRNAFAEPEFFTWMFAQKRGGAAPQ